MARVRYIGPPTGYGLDGDELGVEVPLFGSRHVRPDEVVEVDDQLVEDYAWPAELWAVEVDGELARDVLARVDGDPTAARSAITAEEAREKPRTTLLAQLRKIAAAGGGDGQEG